MKKQKRLLIIDGNALVHRAYHALPPLKTRTGEMVNAVYGFFSIFLKALKDLQPEFVVAAFDLHAPTFRHKKYVGYKAKRKKAPDELYAQLAGVKKVLTAFEVPVFEKQGFEADDLIGTIANLCERKQIFPKMEIIVLSGDLDTLQLIDEQTKVYTMKRSIKDTILYGEKEVKERFQGLTPIQLIDFKGLRGDASDNIPGVTGIGEKTAINLLNEFGTLENIYKEIEGQTKKSEKIKPSVLEKLKQYKEQAFFSKELGRIQLDVPIDFKIKDCEFEGYNLENVKNAFQGFEFYSLINRLPAEKSERPVVKQGKLLESRNIEDEIDELHKQGVFSDKIAKIEKELIPVVEKMEKNGIKLNLKCITILSKELKNSADKLEKEIYKIANKEFNLNSPKQLSEILFSKLEISSKGLRKTPGGAISIGAGELEKLQNIHPIIDLILQYREVFKLKSGFVDSLPRMLNLKDGRIHPNFHQLGTETGRMSCSSPNLQNIPTKTELGREVRKCFEAEQGYVFVSADYSQTELRIAASISKDKKMLSFFNQGKDVHKMTASQIFDVSEDKVDNKMRKIAKTIGFGVLYGMGPHRVARQTGISFKEAQNFIAKYFERFDGIAKYIEDSVAKTKEKGFSQTLLGRKRFLSEINSRDPRMRAQAERMARNFPMQGSAADIIKIAMIEVDNQLSSQCKMLLQIHDELLFEVKEDIAEQVALKIEKIMENIVKLDAGLNVDISIGKNWGDLKDMLKYIKI